MSDEFFYDKRRVIFDAAFGKNGKCFLLIDASLEQYQLDGFLYDTLKSHKPFRIVFSANELQDALPLYLYPLNSIEERDNKLFDDSICHALNELKCERLNAGQGRSVCAWISTELTGIQLAEQIASLALQSIQSYGDILLRYFDPAVIGPLMPVLDSWQKQQLLSNINAWCYIDGDGIAQVVNGDGECKRKLNYSLGLTKLNVSEMRRIVDINKILCAYRKMDIVGKLSEYEAVKLLHPALGYFYSTFLPSDNDISAFGVDVLIAQRLFYQCEVFNKSVNHGKKTLLYSTVKSKNNN